MSKQLSAEEFHRDIALPLLSWLKTFNHTELPSSFTDMIEKDENLRNKVYNQNGINISIHSLATLANNNALDRAVVDNTLNLFENAFSSTNTIFVPSEITSHWQEEDSFNAVFFGNAVAVFDLDRGDQWETDGRNVHQPTKMHGERMNSTITSDRRQYFISRKRIIHDFDPHYPFFPSLFYQTRIFLPLLHVVFFSSILVLVLPCSMT
ncbi:hypothetical protein BC939DRAFT_273269 [Gamsiella multidivaricata]|uniref:uncharacterized protein n=1 Tax=Gamsiella multidivaricata TaxID=101098 RepID=UPI00221F9DAA|nr:uncharacterized protein BC939DRAFT_273269 [Gamsiella multidivaricata]KAI7819029.1 hypothetical protein BC939DRAFT_273269 [Gamsiella multidivaricata]